MRHYRFLGAMALALVLGACNSGSNPADAAGSGMRLSHSGRWLVDAQGRVVILHGLNEVWKFPPYYPSAAGFGDDDAQYIASQGFNVVRVGVIYKGLEPQPGQIDDAYLQQIGQTIDTLAANGIYTLLDFHQDMYNEEFAGEGFPDWAVQDDGLPTQPSHGFPGNYLLMPALWHAFDHFWNNSPAPDSTGLQDHYAAAWKHVAQNFRNQDMIVGYDVFNEPWPGSVYPSCVKFSGCPTFDTNSLAPFYKKVFAAIRQADQRHILFYEPNPMFNDGSQTYVGDLGDPLAGMTWHVYCLIPTLTKACDDEESRAFTNAGTQAATYGDASLMSEFGATDDLTVIERVVTKSEAHMDSWIYWAWGGNDPTTSGGTSQSVIVDETLPPTDDNLKQAKLDVLARPFPQAVAGTPQSFGFDPATRTFTLTYTTARVDGKGKFGTSARTRIFLPTRQYPNGYTVTVTGGHALTNADARLLDIRADAEQVVVTVVPQSGG
jgi:endoglycosylceramidase